MKITSWILGIIFALILSPTFAQTSYPEALGKLIPLEQGATLLDSSVDETGNYASLLMHGTPAAIMDSIAARLVAEGWQLEQESGDSSNVNRDYVQNDKRLSLMAMDQGGQSMLIISLTPR